MSRSAACSRAVVTRSSSSPTSTARERRRSASRSRPVRRGPRPPTDVRVTTDAGRELAPGMELVRERLNRAACPPDPGRSSRSSATACPGCPTRRRRSGSPGDPTQRGFTDDLPRHWRSAGPRAQLPDPGIRHDQHGRRRREQRRLLLQLERTRRRRDVAVGRPARADHPGRHQPGDRHAEPRRRTRSRTRAGSARSSRSTCPGRPGSRIRRRRRSPGSRHVVHVPRHRARVRSTPRPRRSARRDTRTP